MVTVRQCQHVFKLWIAPCDSY